MLYKLYKRISKLTIYFSKKEEEAWNKAYYMGIIDKWYGRMYWRFYRKLSIYTGWLDYIFFKIYKRFQ